MQYMIAFMQYMKKKKRPVGLVKSQSILWKSGKNISIFSFQKQPASFTVVLLGISGIKPTQA